VTRLTWLRIFAHALICIAVAYDKAFAEELIAERDVFADLGHPRPSRHLSVQALRRADRRWRKRVEPRRPRPAERAAEGRDRYWLAPGLEAVG